MDKTGSWHIRQLVKECTNELINASMSNSRQLNNPYLIDSTLDMLIKHKSMSIMAKTEYDDLRGKFKEYVTYYVVRNIGRDLDFMSGEPQVIKDEAMKVWPVFMQTKEGVVQGIRK